MLTVRKRFPLGISYISLPPMTDAFGITWAKIFSRSPSADFLNRPRPGASTGFHFSLAAAVAGSLTATSVHAADAVISTALTTPAATSRADGSAPGNLTIAPSGSIRVGSGPAVTVDSSHTLTSSGTVEVTAERNALGVHVNTAGGAITGSVVDNGTINIPGPASSSALWPEFVFNSGIEVSGANIFNGSVTRGAGSTLTVGGNGGTGIGVLAAMTGGISNEGTIRLSRQESFGVKAVGTIASFTNGGAIETTGQESIGVYIGGGAAGGISNRGSIVTGAPASTNSANETVPAVRGGRALWIASDSGAIVLAGNGLTREQETATPPPDGAQPDSSLSVRGSAEALFIGQGGLAGNRNITIGRQSTSGDPTSIRIAGNIQTESAIRSTTPVRAVNITGTAAGTTIFRTTLEGGLRNEGGDITALGRDSTTQGIRIGDYAALPSIYNSGAILARGVDSSENAETGVTGGGGGDAYGIIIETNGRLPSLINDGKITADARGGPFSAYGIADFSGTLTSFDNRGNLVTARRGSGIAVAFDLTRAAGGASVRNSGTMSGSMNFGAGADSFSSTAGVLLGNLNMGAGNDTVSLADTTLTGNLDLGDGAHTVTFTRGVLEGGLTLGTGTAEVDVNASTLTIPNSSSVNFTNGRIRGGSTVNFSISALTETVGGLKASGNFVVDAGTVLNTTITGAVVDQFTVNLIEAGSLTMNADLGGLQPGSTVMYQREIRLAASNRNILQYQITRRTGAQLGLSATLGAIYDSSIEGQGQDPEFAGVMAAFTDRAKFEAALAAQVPDTSDAARRSAMTSRALAQSAIQRRLGGFPGNRNDPLGRFRSGFWLQSLTTFGSADDDVGIPGHSLFAQGVSGGVDAILTDQSIVGFGITQTFGSAEEKNRDTGAVKLSTTSLDFYGRANSDFGFVQGTIGYGFNKYKNDRSLEIEGVRRETNGSSPGYQWGATVDAGSSWNTGTTILTGYLRLAYNNVYRHAYEEEGGGPAVDLRYDSTSYTSLRGGGGVQVDRRIQFSASNALSLKLQGGYAREFDDEATSVRARFVAGTTPFVLQGMSPAKGIVTAGAGAAWERRLSTTSLDYDMEKAGPWLGHRITLTYRQRF